MKYNSITTLNEIREHKPCKGGWDKLLTGLGKTKSDDEPLSLMTILDINGLDNALWCLRAASLERLSRHFQAWCAEQVLHIFEAAYPNDNRVRLQIAMLKNDTATDAEQAAAGAAALDAASAAARAALDAAWVAAGAAALDATSAAARAALDAARDAARAATWDARDATWDARDAARAATSAAAWAATWDAASAATWAAASAAARAATSAARDDFGGRGVTDEEFDAAQAGLRSMLVSRTDRFAKEGYASKICDGIAAINTLRARTKAIEEQVADLLADVPCACGYDNPDDVCMKHLPLVRRLKSELAAETARADRAEAELAAQIEADAGIADSFNPCAATAIRNQPHDRTALDRYRETVLRDLAETIRGWRNNIPMTGEECANAILAVIEREGV